MMTLDQKGKYGKYIRSVLTILDFLLLNIVFAITCILSPEIWYAGHTRFVWMLVNVCFIPIMIWFTQTQAKRSIQMNHVVGNSIKAVGVHALFFLASLEFLGLKHIPTIAYVEFYAMCLVIFPLWWILSRYILKKYRKKGLNFSQIVIVGTNSTAIRLQEAMLSDAGYGYKIMGFFDNRCPDDFKGEYLGDISQLESYVKQNGIREIYYAIPGSSENVEVLSAVTKIADNNMIQFFYVPQVSRYISRNFELMNIGHVPVLSIRRNPLKSGLNKFIKRAFDILFSSLFLIFFPLVLIPVAIAIKISSPGPIFFKQLRTGYRGRDFHCWKFRTMRVNVDSDKIQATKDDPRKTKVGDILRRTSIDELPQFINVFLGSMSIVGPRPHMLKHTEDYSRLIDNYMMRHKIKPGITGWAQVNGYRGLTEELWQMEKRVEYDVWYIENWSFLLDLKIIVRTVVNAVRGEKNAF